MDIKKSRSQVLIVDDEKSMRITLKDFLEDDGFEVVTAQDLQQAKNFLIACDFHVAVVDRILTNGENGLELMMHIKEVSPYCQTILMTAYPTVESARITLNSGSSEYLVKPFTKDEICRVVKDACNKSIQLRRDKVNYILAHNSFVK